MSQGIHLSVDAMGGDNGPQPCVAAVQAFLEDHSDTTIHLVGNALDADALQNTPIAKRLNIIPASDVVSMSDVPSHALRHKRESSMWKALEIVRDGTADACISAGNTGALMAMSLHLIKTQSGIKRPAICKPIPTQKNNCYLLDLGANLECGAEHLIQFALMGSALAKVSGVNTPRVALLNIGSEANKGNSVLQQAGAALRDLKDIEFSGFVEGDDLFCGDVDVIVCDGFTGNIALKVSEGLVKFLMNSLHEYLQKSAGGRALYWIAGALLKSWSKKYNPSLFNGAAFLGLQKTVVKSHGGADKIGFYKALETAREQVLNQIPQQIEASLQTLSARPPLEEMSK